MSISSSPSKGGKKEGFFETARRGVHSATASLVEEFSKFGLKDSDSAPEGRPGDKPHAGEKGTRKSLEDQPRKGRDTKPRHISLGLPWTKERASDDLSISDALRGSAKLASVVAPLTRAEEEKKKEDKPEESESDVCLSPEALEATDASDDATPHRGRSRGRKSQVAPYPSTSRAPSRLPSNDWHPTEEPPPTEDDRRGFEQALDGLDKDHQSIVVHYGGNTFWTRWLVLQKILDYHNETNSWPMRVEKTGTSRANEGVHHAECVICGRGTNTQKLLKVQHIAKHLTSDEWKLKPWRCMFCSTAYSYNDGSLKTHMKKVHNKEEYDTRGTADDGTNSTLLTPGISSTSTAVQVDHPQWRNSNEYLHPSPTHSVSTSYQSPPVATPSPSPYQHSNFQPGLDIVRSPPTGISSGGQPVTPTYITSLSLPPSKGKEPTVLPTQPPRLGVAPTVDDPFPSVPPIASIIVNRTFVHQPSVDPSSRAVTALLPHQLGIRQAVALSAHAGRAIVTNPTTDSRSMRSGSFSGTHSHYQPPIQGAISANQIPIGNVVNPGYNAPPLMGYDVAPSNGGTNKPQPVYPGYTGQVVQVPGPSNIRPSQPVSGYAPAPTEPRRQGQPRPPLQIPPPTAATYSIARSSNTDLIGSSDPFMAKSGPISGTTLNTTNTSTRNVSQYPGQYGPTQQLMNQLLSPPHKDYRPSSSF